QWEELSFDYSSIDLAFEYQKVVIFFDFGNPGDGSIYYFDDIKLTSSSPSTGIAGTWKVAPEAGSLGVGPGQGDISWWSIDDAGVIERACYYDDEYIFGTDGSFSNVLQDETWIEGWQGGSDACGTPVAPHDGSNPATFVFDEGAGTVTLNGLGAYLGIPKAYNGGELTTPADAPASITYIIALSDDRTRMTLDIDIGGGWWRFILVKEGGSAPSPLQGTWQVKPEAGSLGVGPGQGDISWWSIDDAGVADRGCFYDDSYVFGVDGSFSNVLGADTWVEGWQGGTDACGTPVAPHDGNVAATFSYDEGAGTVTLNGTGAYLGIPKAYNGGELTNPADAPASITYLIALSDDQTEMTLDIDIGGGWWRFILVKN
ncbi:MAG: glycosyl hydrolase, partial [Marinilabiliales bacterium]